MLDLTTFGNVNPSVVNFNNNDIKLIYFKDGSQEGQAETCIWAKPCGALSITDGSGIVYPSNTVYRSSHAEPTATNGEITTGTSVFYNDIIEVRGGYDNKLMEHIAPQSYKTMHTVSDSVFSIVPYNFNYSAIIGSENLGGNTDVGVCRITNTGNCSIQTSDIMLGESIVSDLNNKILSQGESIYYRFMDPWDATDKDWKNIAFTGSIAAYFNTMYTDINYGADYFKKEFPFAEKDEEVIAIKAVVYQPAEGSTYQIKVQYTVYLPPLDLLIGRYQGQADLLEREEMSSETVTLDIDTYIHIDSGEDPECIITMIDDNAKRATYNIGFASLEDFEHAPFEFYKESDFN